MTDKIEIIDFYTTDADVDGPPTLTYAAWCRNGVRETSGDGPWSKDKTMQSVPLPADVRAAIALLIAPELGQMLDELATWRSIFPDIAPDSASTN